MSYKYPVNTDPLIDDPVDPLSTNQIQNITTGAFIPNDSDNAQWQEYVEWVNEPNTPTESRPLADRVTQYKQQALLQCVNDANTLKNNTLEFIKTKITESEGGGHPLADIHAGYRNDFYTALSITAPTITQIEDDIVLEWAALDDYEQIDGICEQTQWALAQVSTFADVDIIIATYTTMFSNI